MAKEGVSAPTHLQKSRVGGFDVVTYDIALDADGVAANARASWHDDDTWIDLHLSCSGSAASAVQLRAAVLEAVRGLAVWPKG